ncbi:MAG: histidinol-phosphate transaminase [Candidatus Aminicenantes bacterium]|nr:histidinol-phosphate transaminase [Candidatus Aminicenantes bacterium]
MKDLTRYARQGILDLKAYVPGKPVEEVQDELGLTEIIKLASNETPLGPSPMAVAAAVQEMQNIHFYPEGPCTWLRRDLARRLAIADDMISFSNGADNIIVLITAAFINQGDEVVIADPSFFGYLTYTKVMGGTPILVDLKNWAHDLATMSEKVGPKTKLVFVCNPNNPTGTIVRKAELDDFVARLPEHVILVLDEAYLEFVSDRDSRDGLDYIKQGRNVISVRTFSKICGLAGLRIGYALAAREFIAALNRVREPFPVSRVAQAAARAALDDQDYRIRVLANNEVGKSYFARAFDRLGLPFAPSQTNFVFVDLQRDSQEVFRALLKMGVIIRPGSIWNCPTCARITIGTPEQNRRFIHALEDCLRTSPRTTGTT